MTPEKFIEKWKLSTLKERSASQSHFIDLCELLDEPNPTDVDQDGSWFMFERGAKKTGGGDGWADVWKKGCFGWEYKGKRKNLDEALKQLQQYAIALDNPPLLIVSDMDKIIIHTNFTNTISEVHTILIDDLIHADTRNKLKAAFTDPNILKPSKTRDAITADAAQSFAELAQRLRERKYEPKRVAHFINKLLFCMFAEDIGILKQQLFTNSIKDVIKTPERFEDVIKGLFATMSKGGYYGSTHIPWFNGGLFDDNDAIPLTLEEIQLVLKSAQLDWSDIEPAIFGTLFERGLDPSKRSQLGAHYTDRTSIMRIIEPVIEQPLLDEWIKTKEKIKPWIIKKEKAKSPSAATRAQNKANEFYYEYLERLRNYRVLDPACGSGNFLYLALFTLKNLEHRASLDAEAMGLLKSFPLVSPEVVMGIEINPYAAELARVTVWIGEIQWMLNHGYSVSENPILKPLDNIQCRDALMDENGQKSEWPDVDSIIGNPPFLGKSKLITQLGEEYTKSIRKLYSDKVPGGADLVCWWFAKANEMMDESKVKYAGLVSTNSIRGGQNRVVLENITDRHEIFNAWSDEDWINEGATVRVSLICFKHHEVTYKRALMLDGEKVTGIYPDLSHAHKNQIDVRQIVKLKENSSICFEGTKKTGMFDITGEVARDWLVKPLNPNGKPNSDVVKPWINGKDITGRTSDKFIIDFGVSTTELDASLYELPFEWVKEHIKPVRAENRRKTLVEKWWIFGESRPALRKAITGFTRVIATVIVSKHRLFVFIDARCIPSHSLSIIARDDYTTFGILHSRFHEVWALRQGTSLEDRPRYTSSTTFETFPFPKGLTPNLSSNEYTNSQANDIAEAAERLYELRKNWLNPPELVRSIPEVVDVFPDRIEPINSDAAKDLKKRTLTNLYNSRPSWLDNAHKALDQAVADAYGWDVNLSDEEILQHLLKLNQERAESQTSI